MTLQPALFICSCSSQPYGRALCSLWPLALYDTVWMEFSPAESSLTKETTSALVLKISNHWPFFITPVWRFFVTNKSFLKSYYNWINEMFGQYAVSDERVVRSFVHFELAPLDLSTWGGNRNHFFKHQTSVSLGVCGSRANCITMTCLSNNSSCLSDVLLWEGSAHFWSISLLFAWNGAYVSRDLVVWFNICTA